MKKIVLFLLVFLLLFCSCSAEKALPSLTPFAAYIQSDLGDSVHFEDYHNGDFVVNRFAMPTGTDDPLPEKGSFFINKETGVAAKIPVFKNSMCYDGEYHYYFDMGAKEHAYLFRSADFIKFEALIPFEDHSTMLRGMYNSGGYIIVPAASEEKLYVYYYNIETGDVFTFERNCRLLDLSGTDIAVCNGCFAFVEQRDNQYYLMGIDPKNPNKVIKSCSVPVKKILSCAFDGETFVWQTEEGIYHCKKNSDEIHTVFEGESTGFAFLGGRYIVYGDAKQKVTFFYDITNFFAGMHFFALYDFAFSDYDECTAVLIPKSENEYPSGTTDYVVLEMLNINYGDDMRWSVPCSLMVDGKTYYCFFEKTDVKPDAKQISGRIRTIISDPATMPSEDDQANFGLAGMPYAFVDKNLYLYTSNNSGYAYFTNWYKCEHADHID